MFDALATRGGTPTNHMIYFKHEGQRNMLLGYSNFVLHSLPATAVEAMGMTRARAWILLEWLGLVWSGLALKLGS